MEYPNVSMQGEYFASLKTRELSAEWNRNRRGSDYLNALHGLGATLDEIRKVKPHLIDVGTGSSQGISEIARTSIGQGLKVSATDIIEREDHLRHLGKDNIAIIPAELIGATYPLVSVGGVISVRGLTHSEYPETVVKGIDKVLCVGGIVKLVGREYGYKSRYDEKTTEIFGELFTNLGYDVYCPIFGKDILANDIPSILLAIKAGRGESPSARFLYKQDCLRQTEDICKLRSEVS